MARDRPLRLLLLVTDLEVGGTPRVVRDLAIRLRGPEIDTTVACLAPAGPVAGEIEAHGVRVVPFGLTSPRQLPSAVQQLAGVSRSFDVVYSLLMHANVVAALSRRLAPGDTRLLQSIQTTQPYPRWHWVLQGMVQGVERFIVPSPSVADLAGELAHIPRERIAVIPNAIDVESFAAVPPPDFSGVTRVGFIGRLDPIKRVPDLVEAMAAVPDATLHIFGEGEDRARISATIERLRLSSRVTLHGMAPSPEVALGSVDLLVLPSAAEGFGLVLIEAMAASRPVVATDVPGIRDVVASGRNGLLVPAQSPAAIAQAILRLSSDAALRRKMSAEGLSTVRERYAWPAVLEAYRRLLLG